MSIEQNLNNIISKLPEHVTLIAVSKTKSVSEIMEAYNAGQRLFGENKIQEMAEKFDQLPKDIDWHMIGHVQRNKVKYMAEFVDLIHGVDSLKLLKEIDKQAKKYDRTINCLLQIKIAEEESKFGMSEEAAKKLILSEEFYALNNVSVIGVMGMATYTDEKVQIEHEFKRLKTIFEKLKTFNNSLNIISMGMSGDFQLAIECGSTMIRVGSSIFGSRNYSN